MCILRAGHSFRFWENAIVLENHYATTGGDAHRPGIKPSNLTSAQYIVLTGRLAIQHNCSTFLVAWVVMTDPSAIMWERRDGRWLPGKS